VNLEQLSIEYIVVSMAVIILYLLYYVFTKEAECFKNIHSIASVVEELNRELFYIKKTLDDTQEGREGVSQRGSYEQIYQEMQGYICERVEPLSSEIEQIDSRILNLQKSVEQISMSASTHEYDEEKIIALFEQGSSLESIAKELYLSQSEVEFVLKINKIK